MVDVAPRVEGDLHFSAAEYMNRHLIAHPVQFADGTANQASFCGGQLGQIGKQTGWIDDNIRRLRCH